MEEEKKPIEDNMNESLQDMIQQTIANPELLGYLATVLGISGGGAAIGKALQKNQDSGKSNKALNKMVGTRVHEKKKI